MDQLKLDPKLLNAQGYVAVAVDKGKGSQKALRWAADNLLIKGQSVTLIHVNQSSVSSPSPSISMRSSLSSSMRSSRSSKSSRSLGCEMLDDEHEQHDQSQDMFVPFRMYTSCKDISCDAVIIDDSDVVKALIEYVKVYRIENLVLGASTKHGISRIFNKHDIPTAVLKGAPDFCNVFVISKGKVSLSRAALRPLRSHSIGSARMPIGPRSSFNEKNNHLKSRTWHPQGLRSSFNVENRSSFKATTTTYQKTISEEITNLNKFSSINSTDSGMINEALETKHELSSLHTDTIKNEETIPVNDHMESQPVRKPSKCLSTNTHDLVYNFPEVNSDDNSKRKSSNTKSGENKRTSPKEIKKKRLTPEKIEALEEKLRLLELETKQTMDMYYSACKEALKEKEKNNELHLLREENERKLAEALMEKEEALAMAKKEKAIRIAAIEAARVAQAKADEMHKRNSEETRMILDSIDKS